LKKELHRGAIKLFNNYYNNEPRLALNYEYKELNVSKHLNHLQAFNYTEFTKDTVHHANFLYEKTVISKQKRDSDNISAYPLKRVWFCFVTPARPSFSPTSPSVFKKKISKLNRDGLPSRTTFRLYLTEKS
jgi:hypothetical protein